METLYLNEMLRILFLSHQKNPERLAYLFNDSISIAAFDYDLKKEKFNCLSHSLNNFLGIPEFPCDIEGFILYQLIHPNDINQFKEYFTTSSVLTSKQKNSTSIFKRMKCRLKYKNSSWKYFIFISINQIHENANYAHKIGFIVEELPIHGFQKIGNGATHLVAENEKDINNELHITKRENEVLEFISQGMIAKEIALKLNISVTTVISHRKNLINKFHVKNTAELIREASRLMIV